MKKRQNAETRKPQIIKAFYETILEEGVEGASIAKVGKRINMNATLILHYFGNKENLTLECVNYTLFSYAKLIKRLRSKPDDPEERLMALLRTLWSKDYYEKVHIAASFSVIGISFRNDRIRQKMEDLYRFFKTFLVGELAELKDAGVIRVTDVENTADILMTMVEGSRHFSHFFVSPEERETYHHHMILTALGLLKTPYSENI